MAHSQQILVAIEDFSSAGPILDYVGQLAGDCAGFDVHLFHAAGPLPPQLLESPGAERPQAEERTEQQQARQQNLWFERTRDELEPQFAAAKARLVAANVPPRRIRSHLRVLNQREDLVPEMIKAARDNHCGTIVVGRNSYSWLREQVRAHVSEKLIEDTPSLAICVVSMSPTQASDA